jgi:putative ABC transport system permease protein
VVVHANGDASRLIALIRARLKNLDPNLPVYQIKTMDEILSGAQAQPRFNTALFVMFAILAIVLATVGTYGVFSYSVSQRQKEIGIRMALGAKADNVLLMIVKQSITTSLAGMIAGLTASVLLSRFMQSLLFGTVPLDPAIYGLAVAMLILLTLLATALPAKRAANLEPLQALREA